jgi:hypothetical protein
MFSSQNSLFDLQSLDILDYVHISRNPGVLNDPVASNQDNDNQIGLINPEARSNNHYLANKIKYKAVISIVRVFLILFFYYADGNSLTKMVLNLVTFLIIHEAIVISNYAFIYFRSAINRIFGIQSTMQIPRICYYSDVFSNMLFFIWFVYGNLCILTNKSGVEESLARKYYFI